MPDYRTMFDRKYVGAWDLDGQDQTVTITRVVAEELRNKQGANKKPVLYFNGTEKGFALNKTNGAIVAGMYGTRTEDWQGKRITLYACKVAFGPNEVDAIRVRPTIPKAKGKAIEPKPVDPEMRAKQDAAALAAEQEGGDHEDAVQ